MSEIFKVVLDMVDSPLKRDVLDFLAEMDGVAMSDGFRVEEAQNGLAPQLMVFNAEARSDELIAKIQQLRQQLPEAAMFVISPDKSPEHIVEVMKAGADEFFSNPLNAGRFKDAVDKVRQRLASMISAARGQLFSFVSAKGGLGATVVSVNVAAALALKSKGSVALLDMSLQSGDSSVYLDSMPHTTLTDICRNFHRLDFSFLKTSMMRHSTGLHYLAAPKEPEDCGEVQGSQIQKILQLAKNLYDHVVVDCTSMLVDECSLEAFRASDRIFLLTDLSVPALRNAARLSQLMQKLSIPPQRVEVIINRFIKGGASLHDVEKGLHKKIFWLFPNDFDDVIASINAGIPLVKSKPGAPFAKNMFEFVEKLKNPESFMSYRGAKGILGKAI
ncbi:MAG TPA: AAA family ATPase [Geothermobacteraceae bacterium]|nr:AAA family ATPase [Geothermobacteraceae bacterium]